MRLSDRAEIPSFCEANSQQAMNQTVSGVRVLSNTVPAVTDERAELEEAQVLVIVNRYGESLTGNLQGPLVINVDSRVGEQLVLADQRWSTRHRLVDVGAAAHAASA